MTYRGDFIKGLTFDTGSRATHPVASCNVATCPSEVCRGMGECMDMAKVESPPLVPIIELPELLPDQVAYLRELADDRRTNWKAHAAGQVRTIIAFTGLAGAGKSTAAAHLVNSHGFTRLRFAGPLKAMMIALGLSIEQVDGSLKETPCDLLCGKTPRWAMQSIGTEWGRDLIGPDLWIRAWEAALAKVSGNVVVDDCRFPNEAAAVLSNGGILVRVERPGAGTSSVHASEQHALPAAATLHNIADEHHLRSSVDVLLRDLSWRSDASL